MEMKITWKCPSLDAGSQAGRQPRLKGWENWVITEGENAELKLIIEFIGRQCWEWVRETENESLEDSAESLQSDQ